jgi:tetratricopeptide (TPR) repeat protein
MFRTLQSGECSTHAVAAYVLRTMLCMAAFAASLATSSLSFAEETNDDSVTAAARALAVEGVKLAQSDRCAEAIDKLERAEELHHAPIVLARLGECYVRQGRLVEGIERLRSVLREPLPANPSAALQQAYTTSKNLLESAPAKLATLTISIDAPPNANATVTIDDKPVPPALLGARRPTDPGEHFIKASAPGYLTTTRRLSLSQGEEQNIMLALVMDASLPRAAAKGVSAAGQQRAAHRSEAAAGSPPSAANPAQTAGGPKLLPAYVAWGASALALGVGIGFGVAALNNQNDLEQGCPGKICAAEQRTVLDTARTNATISTAGFVGAIAGATLGTVLYFVLGRAETPSASDSARDARRVTARARPAGTELSISF